MISLDNNELFFEFNINSGPLFNGTKIILFLDGDIFYDAYGIPQYNRTLSDLEFDLGNPNDL
jgi:hypothetical protein